MSNKSKYYIALHVELLLFSLGGVCTKLAGQHKSFHFGSYFFMDL